MPITATSWCNSRLALGVEVEPGDKHMGKHVSKGLWRLLDRLPRAHWPTFIRGDIAFGSESILHEAEARKLHYKRPIRGEMLLSDDQMNLAFIDTEDRDPTIRISSLGDFPGR